MIQNSRYIVGNTYLFIRSTYTVVEPRAASCRVYIPWACFNLQLETIRLLCIEQRSSPGYPDISMDFDIFDFVDDTGKLWINPGPRSILSQIDDRFNWRVCLSEDVDRRRSGDASWWTDAIRFLINIDRRESSPHLTVTERSQMRDYLHTVEDTILSNHGRVVVRCARQIRSSTRAGIFYDRTVTFEPPF